ncbi:MAG: hypothetical protein RLZ45_2969 [Verrucomicrobiota bacterium]
MIHRLLPAVFRDVLGRDGGLEGSFSRIRVSSDANTMLEAVAPFGQGIPITLFRDLSPPPGCESVVPQNAVCRCDIGHGQAVPANRFASPLSKIPLFPFERGHVERLHPLTLVTGYSSQWIRISFSNALNSLSPVTSSAFFSFAKAAAKASARLSLWQAL